MKFNLSTIINAVSHAVLYAATALLVVIAIFISIIRWYPNLSDIVEHNIESRLADILHADVNIESLDVSRNKLLSEIIAENVEIIDRDNKDNVWQLRKAKLAINLSKSLLTQSLRIKEVSLEGMDLSIERDETGDIHINQKFLLPSSKMTQGDGNTGASKYTDVRLALIDANIHWIDQLTHTNYLFKELDVAIEPTWSGHDVFISGDLPEVLGDSLEAYLQVKGDVTKLSAAEIKFYLMTEQFHLSEVAKRFIGESGNKVPVVIDSEVWGTYSKNTLASLRGTVSAEKIVEDPDQINKELCLSDEYLQQVSMDFDWKDVDNNWQFQANNLEVISSKSDWPRSEMQFELQRHSLNAKSIFAHIGSMNLGAVCNTLHTYSPHIVRFEDQLKDYRLNASIENLFIRFDLSDNHQASYQFSTQFNDASMWMSQGDRLFSGISGTVEGGDTGGIVLLDAPQVSISVPEQLPGFDVKFATQGKLVWSHHGELHKFNSNNLRIYNDDLSLHARLHAEIQNGAIYTDSQLHLDYANASVVGNYFPLFVKTRTTKKWLTEAIHKGDVTAATTLIRGNMRVFPFHTSSGVFQTQVNVENGILEYKKDWPKLEQVQAKVLINKDHINIISNHATTLNSKVKRVDINIESFLRSILKLNGTVDGPAQDLLRFLGEASLVKKTNSVLDQISLQGDSRLEVDFSRSLSKKIDYPARVSGNINFLGNTLDINKVGIELNELAGDVAFDADGASGESIIAKVYGHPVNLSLDTAGNGASSLKFEGGFDLGEYLSQKYPRFKSFFNGTADVSGELHLPSFFKKNNPDKLKLKINSNLQGIESKLPVPLKKDKQAVMKASIAYDQKQHAMSWNVDDLIGLHFTLEPQQPFALRVIDLDAVEQKEVPTEGLIIKGHWQEAPPLQWLAAYKQYASLQASDAKASGPPKIDVAIDSLLLPQWPAKDVRVLGELKDNRYVLDLDSSLGKGVIDIPLDKSQAISVDMNTLIFNRNNQTQKSTKQKSTKKVASTIDPKQLRPFVFSSSNLIFNEIKLTDVFVNTAINESGMVFDDIKLAAQDMNVSGSGAWNNVGGQHTTSLNFQLESIDLEDTLDDLGFKSSLKKGEANASGNISWSAAPHQFELAKMSGSTSFKIKDGSVSEINPGKAGRLLALLNLGAITRRLSLDFKDVTSKGFTFDSIKGDLSLKPGGNLETEKVAIKASAADIEINGKTNIVNQTYDQTVFVTPAVSGTLPAAGAIVGGPIGAAAGILADRVANVVGLNKMSKIEYKMTGTWQDPVIEAISKKKRNPAVETTGQPSSP